MTFGYINRNNNVKQLDPQNNIFGEYTIDQFFVMEEFTKYPSGRLKPPTYKEDAEQLLLDTAGEGDIIITSSLTNFSATIAGILRSIAPFLQKKIRIIACDENFDSDVDGQKILACMPLLLTIQHNIDQSRHNKKVIGMMMAKEQGKPIGKAPYSWALFDNFEELYKAYKEKSITKVGFAKELDISRPSLDKLIKEYEHK